MINYNISGGIEMNGDLNNGDVSCGNGFINSHILSQCNESISFNDVCGDVENGDMSGRKLFINIHALYEANRLSSSDSTKKRGVNVLNVS